MKRLLLAALLGALLWQAAGASAGPPLGGFLEGDQDAHSTYLARCSLLRTDAKMWIHVKYRYSLTITSVEEDELYRMLSYC